MDFKDDLFIYKQNMFPQHKKFVSSFNFPRSVSFDSIDALVDLVLEFRSIRSTVEKLDSTNDAELLRFKNIILLKESSYKDALMNNYLSLKLSRNKKDVIKKLKGLSTLTSAFNFKSSVLSYLEDDLLKDFKNDLDRPSYSTSLMRSSLKYFIFGASLFVAGYFSNNYFSNIYNVMNSEKKNNISSIKTLNSINNSDSQNAKKTYHLNNKKSTHKSSKETDSKKIHYYSNNSSPSYQSSKKSSVNYSSNSVSKNDLSGGVSKLNTSSIDASVNYSIGRRKNN